MNGEAAFLERISALSQERPTAFIGLDGFVDQILRVVDKRYDAAHCSFISSLSDYGRRISQASGLSLNVEIVKTRSQLGGNGPIMAQACASLGAEVICLGAMGVPELAAEFQPLAQHARLYSVSEPARTDAWEFDDGKIIVSQLSALHNITWDTITAHVSEEALRSLMECSDLIALNNWTMIPAMPEIWLKLQADVLPLLSMKDRLYFFDLADPSKRTKEDLLNALSIISGFQPFGRVLLSCNKSELLQIAAALDCAAPDDELPALAEKVRSEIKIWALAVHALSGAFMAGEGKNAEAEGFYTEKPLISVGGGDHFNAGLAWGLLGRLSWEESLRFGSAVSGYYVRTGKSPTLQECVRWIAEEHP